MPVIKYQIFISSTFEDLVPERDQVIKAVLEMGHIPVGMEMFSAADEQQWEIIKKQIDQSNNRGQNTDSAKILEHKIYGLFFLYTWAPWLTRTYLSFAHTLDFVFEVLSAQHPFLVQGFTNCMDLPRIPRHAK
jgi:hypothetical protein